MPLLFVHKLANHPVYKEFVASEKTSNFSAFYANLEADVLSLKDCWHKVKKTVGTGWIKFELLAAVKRRE